MGTRDPRRRRASDDDQDLTVADLLDDLEQGLEALDDGYDPDDRLPMRMTPGCYRAFDPESLEADPWRTR